MTTPAAVHTLAGLPPVMSQISAVKTSALAWIAAPCFDLGSLICVATASGVRPANTRWVEAVPFCRHFPPKSMNG